MAHFAQIDSNNKVVQVIVVDDANVTGDTSSYITNILGLSGTWVQTSFNTRGGIHTRGGTPLRKNFAGKGFTYDAIRDAFIPPQPYPSWVLNESTCQWHAPVPYPYTASPIMNSGSLDNPTATIRYKWNETNLTWEEYTPSVS